jgi:hypothetical protein
MNGLMKTIKLLERKQRKSFPRKLSEREKQQKQIQLVSLITRNSKLFLLMVKRPSTPMIWLLPEL